MRRYTYRYVRMYVGTLTRHEPFISKPEPWTSTDRGHARRDDKAPNPHADFRAGSFGSRDAGCAEYIRLNDHGLLNAN